MIDTHAHLDFEQFDDDREEVISRFFKTGGKAIINVGVDLERSRKGVAIAEKYKNIFAAVGFHPHEAGEKKMLPNETEFKGLRALAMSDKTKAIGEIGLDYFYYKNAKEVLLQKKLFLKQIEMAEALGLPVAVHCRDAWDDLHEMIRDSELSFVLHCYSGAEKDTRKFLKLPNVSFSFSANITYPKPLDRTALLAEAVRMIPIDRIMLDSDSPFLSPQEVRGKRNEPINILYIAKKIAEIKKIGADEVESETDMNAIKFFGL